MSIALAISPAPAKELLSSFGDSLNQFREDHHRNNSSHDQKPADPEVFYAKIARERAEQFKLSRGQFVYEGIEYHSRSEAACAVLLERYLDSFMTVPGESFQVPLSHDSSGNVRAVDFLVEGILLEYHPPKIYARSRKIGDFKSTAQRKEYWANIHRLDPGEREVYRQKMRKELTENYRQKRVALVETTPFAGCELVVVTSPEEFYRQILKRFATRQLPSEKDVVREFRKIQDAVSKRASRKQARQAHGRTGKKRADRRSLRQKLRSLYRGRR